jgi:hypothetical protein
MKDDKDRFYLWSEFDGYLFWVRDIEIEELKTLDENIEFIIGSLGCLEVEPVYRPSILLMTRIWLRFGRGLLHTSSDRLVASDEICAHT